MFGKKGALNSLMHTHTRACALKHARSRKSWNCLLLAHEISCSHTVPPCALILGSTGQNFIHWPGFFQLNFRGVCLLLFSFPNSLKCLGSKREASRRCTVPNCDLKQRKQLIFGCYCEGITRTSLLSEGLYCVTEVTGDTECIAKPY